MPPSPHLPLPVPPLPAGATSHPHEDAELLGYEAALPYLMGGLPLGELQALGAGGSGPAVP